MHYSCRSKLLFPVPQTFKNVILKHVRKCTRNIIELSHSRRYCMQFFSLYMLTFDIKQKYSKMHLACICSFFAANTSSLISRRLLYVQYICTHISFKVCSDDLNLSPVFQKSSLVVSLNMVLSLIHLPPVLAICFPRIHINIDMKNAGMHCSKKTPVLLGRLGQPQTFSWNSTQRFEIQIQSELGSFAAVALILECFICATGRK